MGRKNRDAMISLLDELHEQGKLTSMSLWMELFSVISQDYRFHAMLGQPGSTPLDLFKFYVEDLKARFSDKKKIIKDILKEKDFEMMPETTFEDFATIVCEDKRSASLDAGNVKLTYNALLEKAESKEKERVKEENKRLKKIEGEARLLFGDLKIDEKSSWEDVWEKIRDESVLENISERRVQSMFKDYVHDVEESCMHNHGKNKKKKSKKKKKVSSSDSESDDKSRRKKHKHSDSSESESESEYERKKRRKKKKKARSRSASRSPSSEDSHSKRKKRRNQSRSRSARRDSTSPPKKDRRTRSPESAEEGELSEEELERKRML